jgi:DNA-binding NtrC family response regulator
VADGDFRADLYHRLNGAPIRIPPLRERKDDIVPLAEHFAARMARALGRSGATIAPDAAALLEAYPWPGNVRELRNVVERAVVLTGAGRLVAADLDLEVTGVHEVSVEATVPDDAGGLRAELDAMERRRVIEALEKCGNNQSRAAKLLGISRHALIARIERYNLQRPRKTAAS